MSFNFWFLVFGVLYWVVYNTGKDEFLVFGWFLMFGIGFGSAKKNINCFIG